MSERIAVTVHPRSRKPRVEAVEGSLHVWVAAAPSAGAANAELVERVAEHLGLPLSAVRIVSGATGRKKLLEIRS